MEITRRNVLDKACGGSTGLFSRHGFPGRNFSSSLFFWGSAPPAFPICLSVRGLCTQLTTEHVAEICALEAGGKPRTPEPRTRSAASAPAGSPMCVCGLGPAAERLTQSSGSRRWEVMNSSVLRVIRESLGPGTRIFDSAGLSGIKEPDGV